MDQISYSPRQIRRGMTTSIWAAIMWSFYAAFVGGPILPGLELALNFTPQQCALINSMGNIFLPMQLIGLYIQERYFHRTRYWGTFSTLQFTFFGALGVLAYFYPNFSMETGFLLFALTFAAQGICSSMIAPIGMTWHADFIPARSSNAFWSRRNGMYMLFSMLSGIGSGILLDRLGQDSITSYSVMLIIGMIFGYASGLIQIRIPDPNPYPHKQRENPIVLFKETLQHKAFRTIIMFFSVQAAGAWMSAAFSTLYLLQTMNMNMKTIQILVAISAAISFICSYFFQIVGTKYGRKPVLILCTIMAGCQYLIFASLLPGNTIFDDLGNSLISHLADFFNFAPFTVPPGALTVLPIYLIAGVTTVGIASAQQSLITSQGDRRIQGTAIALFYSIIGVCGAVTGMASGWIYKFLESFESITEAGFHPFNIMALCSAIVFFLSLFLINKLQEDGAVNARKMMRVLVTENSIRQVFQSYALARPLSEQNRVDKLQTLHGSMVSEELLADLYSPSSRVRDEAVTNLCSIEKPSAETIRELIKLSGNFELGMRVPAMRALGRMRAKAALSTAIHLAEEGELPLAQAAVFTIGMIGDEQGAAVLKKILLTESRGNLHAAAAEALSRIGGKDDAALIFRAYLSEYNDVLTLQTLLSLSRVWNVDGKESVYKLFDAELRRPGETLEQCLSDFCSAKYWGGIPTPATESLTALLDKGEYFQLGAQIINRTLSIMNIEIAQNNAEHEIGQLFTRDGHWKGNTQNTDTGIIEILATLWGDIRNRPDERINRMRIFTILCGARNILWRKLKPDEK